MDNVPTSFSCCPTPVLDRLWAGGEAGGGGGGGQGRVGDLAGTRGNRKNFLVI